MSLFYNSSNKLDTYILPIKQRGWLAVWVCKQANNRSYFEEKKLEVQGCAERLQITDRLLEKKKFSLFIAVMSSLLAEKFFFFPWIFYLEERRLWYLA